MLTTNLCRPVQQRQTSAKQHLIEVLLATRKNKNKKEEGEKGARMSSDSEPRWRIAMGCDVS
jgi:hypothetical protein